MLGRGKGFLQYHVWKGNRAVGKKKCYLHGREGNGIAVMLVPARTDTGWFHEYIYNKKDVEVRFLKGRLKFGGSKNSAPFPSMVVVFGERRD